MLLFASGALATRFKGRDAGLFKTLSSSTDDIMVTGERANAATGERLFISSSLHFYGLRRDGNRGRDIGEYYSASSPAWQSIRSKSINSTIDNTTTNASTTAERVGGESAKPSFNLGDHHRVGAAEKQTF